MTEVAGAGRAVALSQAIKVEARRLGFDHCRITPVAEAPHAGFFSAWLAHGRAGEMAYLTHHVEKRRDPARLAEPGAPAFRSLIVLGVNHFQFALPPAAQADPSRGLIASYAWGDDYHEIIRPQLYALDGYIRRQTGRTTQGKCLVDTGPVLERDWAQAAGIGFTGKNCCTIHPADGSWLLLATVLVPELLVADPPPRPVQAPELPPDAVARGLVPSESVGSWQLEANGESALATCGRCTRCLDACPTHAFVGPFHLDPQRCISYWTIEAKGPIPRMLRPHFGNRIFGCDICQEVCPWNQRLPARTPLLAGLAAQEERIAPPLLEGFSPANPYWLDEGAFRARFRRSPLLRAKRRGMLRNVCVALGNWADPQATPALLHALRDPEPLARGHAAWALGQIYRRHGFEEAQGALAAASHAEHDAWVRDEIANALAVD